MKEFGVSATWSLQDSNEVKRETKGWRFARIQKTGWNQSGSTYSLSLCGLEIYGRVTGVIHDPLVTVKLSSSSTRIASSAESAEKRTSSHVEAANKEGKKTDLAGSQQAWTALFEDENSNPREEQRDEGQMRHIDKVKMEIKENQTVLDD